MTATRETGATTSARLSSFGLEDDPLGTTLVVAERAVTDTLHVIGSLEEVRSATETVAGSA